MEIAVTVRIIAVGFLQLITGLVMDSWNFNGVTVSDAEARGGRPVTPGSVAGVSRRTTRRTIRRTSIYAA